MVLLTPPCLGPYKQNMESRNVYVVFRAPNYIVSELACESQTRLSRRDQAKEERVGHRRLRRPVVKPSSGHRASRAVKRVPSSISAPI